jgi:hypothetical protein
MVMIHVCVKMHLDLQVRSVESIFGTDAMNIVVLSFAGQNSGEYDSELAWADLIVPAYVEEDPQLVIQQVIYALPVYLLSLSNILITVAAVEGSKRSLGTGMGSKSM